MTLQASGVMDTSDINVELGRSPTATLGLGSDAGVRTLVGSGSVGTQIAMAASLYGKSNFTLTNPCPSGSAEVSAPGSGTTTSYITFGANGYITAVNGTQQAYGSPPSSGIGASKYFYWAYNSGSTCNYGSAPQATWTAFAGQTIGMTRSGVGTRNGTIVIYTANDSGGGGQTSPGTWSINATNEGGA